MNPKYLLAAAAALSLGACSTDDTCTDTIPEKRGHKISFTVAEDSETRTTLDKDDNRMDILRWVETDGVGIYAGENSDGNNLNSNIPTAADVSKSPVEFVGTLNRTVSPGDKFYAYYPYDEAQSTDPTEVQLTIPAKQKQAEAGVYDGQSHPLVAVPMAFKWDQSSDACRIKDVRFRLLGAIVELQIYSSDKTLHSENEKIRSVTFVSQDPLTGDFTFDLTGVTVDKEPQIEGYELQEVKTFLDEPAAIPATKNEAARIYLTIAPGKYTGRIVVETGTTLYTFYLTTAMNFKRAVIKGLPADLAEAEREINPDAPILFADSEVKRICVGKWDTNHDRELSYQEAANVESLETFFRGESISSFDELRYFTGLQSIGNRAFEYCIGLTSIHLPDGVTAIGNYAFANCFSLTSINIPNVTAIGISAFANCSNLTSINIPNVTAIEDLAFYNCASLKSITIPDGVTSISSSAFRDCDGLTSITIPNKVTMIGERAFYGCDKLESIQLPNGLETINSEAFMNCISLKSIAIPERVTAIGNYAFKDCSNLESIQLPNGLETINSEVFINCSSLKSIIIPDNVTEIKSHAFKDCSNLESIQLPKKLTTINSEVFMNCSSLKSITIPDKVTTVGQYIFRDCSNLESVYCEPTDPPTLALYAFNFMSPSLRIYVPADSVEAYIAAESWNDYKSLIEGY